MGVRHSYMLRRGCTLHILHRAGPRARRGLFQLPFHMLAIFHRRRTGYATQFPCRTSSFSGNIQGISKEARKHRDPRNSHLKRNLFISLRALLFHHGYLSPVLDSARKNNGQPPPLVPSMRCWTRHRSPGPGLLVPCCSVGNHKHKYSVSHTRHARAIPPGSQVVSTCHRHF
jgi:hypothetical protein